MVFQNVAAILDENLELRDKISCQTNRIGYLTSKVAMLLTELEGPDPERLQSTFRTSCRDASVNTDKSLSPGLGKERTARRKQVVKDQQVDASPLIAAVRSAKFELAVLKRERRNIEDG